MSKSFHVPLLCGLLCRALFFFILYVDVCVCVCVKYNLLFE